jgi:hypothetical protein
VDCGVEQQGLGLSLARASHLLRCAVIARRRARVRSLPQCKRAPAAQLPPSLQRTKQNNKLIKCQLETAAIVQGKQEISLALVQAQVNGQAVPVSVRLILGARHPRGAGRVPERQASDVPDIAS